jgi:methionyl-tRNA synthetase
MAAPDWDPTQAPKCTRTRRTKMAKPPYYLTAPVYDAAVPPSLESLYAWVFCDAVARHKRLSGFDVAYLRTVETHGFAGQESGDQRAAAVSKNYVAFQQLSQIANIDCTHSSLLPTENHIHATDILLRQTMRRSHSAIYKAKYQGRFCPSDEIEVSDDPQPADCPVCGHAAELISEDRYFFRLSAFRDRLGAIYKYRPEFIQPASLRPKIEAFIQENLKDIPIGRKAGKPRIPWPDDADYSVCGWYAKLTSYLSGIGFAKDGDENFQKFWPAKLHVVSQRGMEAHTIYWPAFLMAADVPTPRRIFTHGAIRLQEDSTGVIRAQDSRLALMEGDALRYSLLRALPYDGDGEFRLDGIATQGTEDLTKKLGTLADRILTLVARDCDGKIPVPSAIFDHDQRIELAWFDLRAQIRLLFDQHAFREGLDKIWELWTIIDRVLNETIPGTIEHDGSRRTRQKNVIHDACQGLGWLALLMYPVVPKMTDAIWKSLGQITSLQHALLDATPWTCFTPGSPIAPLQGSFSGRK